MSAPRSQHDLELAETLLALTPAERLGALRRYARLREIAEVSPVTVRGMLPHELDSAVDVWREANIARGAPHGPERTARIRAKLSASDALPFVALHPGIVGMALAEPGRFDDGAGEPDPSLLHISMVFVRPAEQGTGVGLSLLLHLLDIAASLGYRRVSVWTARENAPARKLYERAGMTLTGKSAPLRSGTQLQYERL